MVNSSVWTIDKGADTSARRLGGDDRELIEDVGMSPERAYSSSHAALGRAIRDLRVQREFPQSALAQRAGIDVSYLSGLERGRRNASWTVILALANALGVKPSELVKRAEQSISNQP